MTRANLLVKDVCFRYREHLVLDRCSMTLEPGRIYCFLGKNGSGKSTLIRVINGALRPESGTVTLGAVEINRMSKKEKARHIAYVSQGEQGFFNYRVLDLVVMGRNPYLKFWAQPKAEEYRYAKELLDFLSCGHLGERKFQELSGGEKQLVLIARAIAQEATYLLLDEPTSHLDYYYQHQILIALKKIILQKEQAALIALHDPNLAYLFADYIFLLQDGGIVAAGSAAEVLSGERLSNLYGLPVQMERTPSGRISIYVKL